MKGFIILDRVTGKPINNKVYLEYTKAISMSILLHGYLFEVLLEGEIINE